MEDAYLIKDRSFLKQQIQIWWYSQMMNTNHEFILDKFF